MTRHATHNTEDVVVDGVDADLGSGGTGDGGSREHELESGVVDARKVARPRRLMLLGPQCERIHIDSRVRGAAVVLERLHDVEIGALALGEAILAVELELGRDDGVLAPAVHVEGSLGEDKRAGIGHEGAGGRRGSRLRGGGKGDGVKRTVGAGTPGLIGAEAAGRSGRRACSKSDGKSGGNRENQARDRGDGEISNKGASTVVNCENRTSRRSRTRNSDRGSTSRRGTRDRESRTHSGTVDGTAHLEETRGVDKAVGARRLGGAAKGVDRVGEGINGVRVVEGLGTERAEKGGAGQERRAVVDVGVGLHNPHQLLYWVVKVELDLVRGRAHALVAGKLELFDEVLVGVLGHLAALIRVKEHVVDVEGGSDKRLLVRLGDRHGGVDGGGIQVGHGPEALADGAEINVDLDLVVLQGNERERKPGVLAKPEEEGNVEGGLGESIAGGAHLGGAGRGGARAGDAGKGGIRNVGESRRVADHLPVAALLGSGHGDLVPDVHPVTVLAVNALTTNLHLNLGDELLTNVVEPAGIDTTSGTASLGAGGDHVLVNLGEHHLEVRAVGEITVAGHGAGHTATKIGLAGKGLLDGLHRKVGVAAVRDLPEGDLGRARKEDVLGAVGDKLHKSSTHGCGLI